MPKYICVRDCYIDAVGNGKHTHYQVGQMVVAEKRPMHFTPVGEVEVDLLSSPGELILASSVSTDDLVDFLYTQYDRSVDESEEDEDGNPVYDRKLVVKELIKARYDTVDVITH